MANKPHILLFGESVLMDSVAESLIEQEFSNVIRNCTSSLEAVELVNSQNPDLIVYELSAINSDPILRIIRE